MTDEEQPPRQHMLSRDQVAAIVYNDLRERERSTFEVANNFGRWLITSLLLVNGGSLAGLFSYLDGMAQDPSTLKAFAIPVWCFVAGIVFAMASGFCAWINWSMHSHNYRVMARYDMLWDPAAWVENPPHELGLNVTNWLATIAGILSLVSAVGGAFVVLHSDYLARLIE